MFLSSFHSFVQCKISVNRAKLKLLRQANSKKYLSTIVNTGLFNQTTLDVLKHEFRVAIGKAFGKSYSQLDPLIFASKSDFGDYQCNIALTLTKQLKQKPQEIGNRIIEHLNLDKINPNKTLGIIQNADVSGPGFINIHLSDHFIKSKLTYMLNDVNGRLGVPLTPCPKKILVDYSSPNIAKEMHVGHLRSTIIGDTIANVLEFVGHNDVQRINHIGDWGTQFGMLIQYMKELQLTGTVGGDRNGGDKNDNKPDILISDLGTYYKAAKKRFDESVDFQEKSKHTVVLLQSGDADTIAAWKYICDISRKEFNFMYKLLNISPKLIERGESFYNPYLPQVVETLVSCGVAVEDGGAKCVFLPVSGDNGRKKNNAKYSKQSGNKSDTKSSTDAGSANTTETADSTTVINTTNTNTTPIIIQKSDGGFLYSTTDLAALKHRIEVQQADHIVYVTDAGQTAHFQSIFEIAKISPALYPNVTLVTNTASGAKNNAILADPVAKTSAATASSPRTVKLSHIPFGLVTGEDGRKIKSRAGDTVRLKELVTEAVRLAKIELVNREIMINGATTTTASGDASTGTAVDGGDSSYSSSIITSGTNSSQHTGSSQISPTTHTELDRRAQIIGIAAIKYADLSYNRESNYKFSFEKMLSFTGNTAPYMLYAYARIQGINRKVALQNEMMSSSSDRGSGSVSDSSNNSNSGDVDITVSSVVKLTSIDALRLDTVEEQALARHLIRLDETIFRVSEDLAPNAICDYMFELSQKFSVFYERCPVIKAENKEVQISRSALCALTAGTSKLCLGLLGIETVEKL